MVQSQNKERVSVCEAKDHIVSDRYCRITCGMCHGGNKICADDTGGSGGMEKEPVIEYTLPDCTPGILIDQAGYRTEDKKVAIFRGKTLPAAFYVYNEKTGETVYEGGLEVKGEDGTTGEQIGYATFTELQTPGEYYIKSDILGYSYSFSIDDKAYEKLIAQNLQSLSSAAQDEADLSGKRSERPAKRS